MVNKSLAVAVAYSVIASAAFAADSPRDLYVAALAHEQAARTALAAEGALPEALRQVHSVVGEYREIVKLYPASGYSDDALWHAGRLSLDAFERFGRVDDKTVGLRLLRTLGATYPTSRLVKLVPDELARFDPSIKLATINEIRRIVLPDGVRIMIEVDAEVAFHEERLSNPARVFVDFAGARAVRALLDQTIRFDGDSDLVHQIRIGRHPNNTTRVVLDATGVGSYSVYPLYDPFRLVIDCVRTSAGTPPALAGQQIGNDWGRLLPHSAPLSAALIRDALTPDEAPTPLPHTNIAGGFSIARQLGLGVSRIAIDPGHGGHDPGARGKGITEAELVLDVALRLEKLLQKAPGTEVVLTRRTDDFVSLQERTAIANREVADLFLSIHANASQNPQVRGIESYFLNFASNLGAAAVAARENAASGQTMGALPDFVKAIALNNKLEESRDFAATIQRAMVERLRGPNKAVKDLGVKQAPFVVLIGAAMPSVLAEISFITNTQEAKLLKGTAYRQSIAEALFNAIRTYQGSLKKIQTVAHQ